MPMKTLVGTRIVGQTDAVVNNTVEPGRGLVGGIPPTAESRKVHAMTDRPTARWLPHSLVLLSLAVAAAAQGGSEFLTEPTWQPAAPDAVFSRLTEYLKAANLAPNQQSEIRDLWQSNAAGSDVRGDLLDRLASCLAKADDRVAVLVDYCATIHAKPGVPEFAWLANSEMPALVRHNMRLFLARWLVQEGYYDEALSWTDGLTTADVVSPEALLFYRAVAYQRLVRPDEADAALGQLLQRQDDLPLRYQKLADLMQQDLAGLEDDSLDHISRRMEDIRRRLAQGRSGDRVQEIENGVVDSLDKLIKQAEEQMQQQSQAGGASGGQQAQQPMQDSQLAPMKAPGEVEHRDIGQGTGWGNLPEKDREKAMQDIGREFPSHYREVIEEYFRRLAAEESAEKP